MKSEDTSNQIAQQTDRVGSTVRDAPSVVPFIRPNDPVRAAILPSGPEDPSQEDVANYVSSMLSALESVTERNGLLMLSQMIAIAREQADDDSIKANSYLPQR